MRRSGFCAAIDEEPGDGLAVADHVLGGGGFVIDVAGVDVCALAKKVVGDFEGAGEVERSLAVAAPGVDFCGVIDDEFFEAVEEAEAGGGMNVDSCAALDGVGGEIRVGAVEEAETAGPPGAAGVDVCAGFEENVEDFVIVYRPRAQCKPDLARRD